MGDYDVVFKFLPVGTDQLFENVYTIEEGENPTVLSVFKDFANEATSNGFKLDAQDLQPNSGANGKSVYELKNDKGQSIAYSDAAKKGVRDCIKSYLLVQPPTNLASQ